MRSQPHEMSQACSSQIHRHFRPCFFHQVGRRRPRKPLRELWAWRSHGITHTTAQQEMPDATAKDDRAPNQYATQQGLSSGAVPPPSQAYSLTTMCRGLVWASVLPALALAVGGLAPPAAAGAASIADAACSSSIAMGTAPAAYLTWLVGDICWHSKLLLHRMNLLSKDVLAQSRLFISQESSTQCKNEQGLKHRHCADNKVLSINCVLAIMGHLHTQYWQQRC